MQSESGAITEWPSAVLERAATHAAGCSQCRQECRERGYYHLHRQLDDPLLLHGSMFFFEERGRRRSAEGRLLPEGRKNEEGDYSCVRVKDR